MPFDNGQFPSFKSILNTLIDSLNKFLLIILLILVILTIFIRSFILDILKFIFLIIIIFFLNNFKWLDNFIIVFVNLSILVDFLGILWYKFVIF